MKILQINNYHHIKGGSDTVYLNTGRLLEKMGNEVIYFSTSHKDNIQDGSNSYFTKPLNLNKGGIVSKLKQIPSYIYSTQSYNSIKKLIKVEKPDIAHLHIFYGQLTSSILKALREEGIPAVMTVHEYRMLCPVSVLRNNKGEICEKCATNQNYRQCIVSKCNRGSYAYSALSVLELAFRDRFFDYKEYIDHFIMVSKFIEKKHSQYFPGIEKKSSILYNFQNIPSPKIKQQKKVDLVYFGRLSREKGIMTLLEVLNHRKDISIKIIGTGPEQSEIQNYVKANSLNNVHLLGFCKGKSLREHICSARFAVVPSEWYENNPMTVIESLFLGVPVIGARIGGIPEIVKKNHGFIFESGNLPDLKEQIGKALKLNQKEYDEMENAAKIFAENNFSEEKHYNQLIKIYSNLLIEAKQK